MAKSGWLKQKINRQDTKHGLLDLPVANLKRFKGMAQGGNVKKVKPLNKGQKQAVMQLLQQAKGAGAPPAPPGPAGPPMMPPPGAGGPPPGMKSGGKAHTFKKGGFVPFEKKGAEKTEGKKGDKKEKWVPPWAKKKGFAAGGSVVCASGGMVGGKGDGCAVKGHTKGRMV